MDGRIAAGDGETGRREPPSDSEREMLGRLLGEIRPGLVRWARKRLASAGLNEVDPEDVVQDAILAALCVIDRVPRHAGSLQRWLNAFIYYLVSNRARSGSHGSRLRHRSISEEAEQALLACEPPPDIQAQWREVSERLLRAIAALEPRDRRLVEDVIAHGKTIRKAAERQGVPAAAAYRRFAHALEPLRAALRDSEEHPPSTRPDRA